jgi:hypothetical protein
MSRDIVDRCGLYIDALIVSFLCPFAYHVFPLAGWFMRRLYEEHDGFGEAMTIDAPPRSEISFQGSIALLFSQLRNLSV